jgi:hypothetical protein
VTKKGWATLRLQTPVSGRGQIVVDDRQKVPATFFGILSEAGCCRIVTGVA